MALRNRLTTATRICAPIAMLLALCSSAPAAQRAPAAGAAQQVDVKLVLAFDVSRSMDDDEFGVEREGTAAAFSDPTVIQAIQNGSLGRIAVALVHFSTDQYNRVVVNWSVIKDRPSALAFAAAIRNGPRSPGRRTSISSAVELGSLLLEASERDFTASRRVIDISGDGPNNFGTPMTEAHDKAMAQGIIINGLPVMDDMANGYFPDLDKYYAGCVTGGRGAFVVVVKSYRDYAAAMRRKLILEISGNETLLKQAMAPAGQSQLLHKVAAAAAPARPGQVQVLPSAPNEFTKNCDIYGGFGGFGRYGGFRRF
ncbi:MAG: DUF1194 domain-containing protein [Alphaproteobacteria bacterium]|nr:DUF1194 domain-containing protein [Alphaproteobacteria bacterium]